MPIALRKSISEPTDAAILSAFKFCQEIPAPCGIDVVQAADDDRHQIGKSSQVNFKLG
jgi:hypothetical protein